MGDFNKEGVPDMAVLDVTNNQVAILLGNRKGSFSLTSGFSLPASFSCISVGDFNGDGNLDLAIGSSQTTSGSHPMSSLFIMLGSGNGNFTLSRTISIWGPANQMVVGDFNNDGHLDIVTIGSMQNVDVVYGDGTGNFSAGTSSIPGVYGLLSVVAADFNGDGNLDLAIATFGQGVQIYFGNGSGSFTPGTVPLLTTALPGSLVSADLNRDGKADLVVTDYASSSVFALLGKGDGTFTQSTKISTGFLPSTVVVGDLNLDGIPDVVVNSGSIQRLRLSHRQRCWRIHPAQRNHPLHATAERSGYRRPQSRWPPGCNLRRPEFGNGRSAGQQPDRFVDRYVDSCQYHRSNQPDGPCSLRRQFGVRDKYFRYGHARPISELFRGAQSAPEISPEQRNPVAESASSVETAINVKGRAINL